MARSLPQTEDDFIRMQQEAIRRVQEMQRRARSTLENAGMHIEGEQAEPTQAAPPPAPSPPPPRPAAQNAPGPVTPPRPMAAGPPPAQPGIGGILPFLQNGLNLPGFSISLDSEQLMLLGILYILFRDHADPWLMMALAYVVFF